MKRYRSSTPRAIAMLAAVGMTVITLGLTVVAPAMMTPGIDSRVQAGSVASTNSRAT